MKQETLLEFESLLRERIPEFRVSYKNQSWLHKVLGFFLKPVNPGYMTDFVTTLGSNVAFPSKEHYLSKPQGSFNVLAHEFVHACDHKKSPVWFTLSYLFPQLLGLLPLLVFGLLTGRNALLLTLPFFAYLACCAITQWSRIAAISVLILGMVGTLYLSWTLVGWTTLWFLGGLLLLGPWPSPGRTHWEKRGYAMSLSMYQWLNYPLTERLKTYMEGHFVTSQYYFMCWSRKKIRAYIDQTLDDARLGRIQNHEPWGLVYDFLRSHRLVK